MLPKNRIKQILLAFILLTLANCATGNGVPLYSMQAPTACQVKSKLGGAISTLEATIRFTFTRYENCFGHKDLLVISWQPDNVSFIDRAVKHYLGEYLNMIKRKAHLIQKEFFQDKYYFVYKLEGI